MLVTKVPILKINETSVSRLNVKQVTLQGGFCGRINWRNLLVQSQQFWLNKKMNTGQQNLEFKLHSGFILLLLLSLSTKVQNKPLGGGGVKDKTLISVQYLSIIRGKS